MVGDRSKGVLSLGSSIFSMQVYPVTRWLIVVGLLKPEDLGGEYVIDIVFQTKARLDNCGDQRTRDGKSRVPRMGDSGASRLSIPFSTTFRPRLRIHVQGPPTTSYSVVMLVDLTSIVWPRCSQEHQISSRLGLWTHCRRHKRIFS